MAKPTLLEELSVGGSTRMRQECSREKTKTSTLPILRRREGECSLSCRQPGADVGNMPDGFGWSLAWITASPVDRMPDSLEKLSAGWCRAQTLSRSKTAAMKLDSRGFQTANTIAPSSFDGSFQSHPHMGSFDSGVRKARVGGKHPTAAGRRPPSCRLSFRLAA